MLLRKALSSCAIAVLMMAPGVVEAKDAHGKNAKAKAKPSGEWPRQTTRGHKPTADNGDGVVSRKEWPGKDSSFRKLDTNHDGVVSPADRQVKPKTPPLHEKKQSR